jgi:ATP-binding cassette subfamily C protein
MQLLFRIWLILNPRDRMVVMLLVFFTLICALLEVFSIGLLVPVLALVQQPDQIRSIHFLQPIITAIGSPAPERFLAFLCLGLFGVFLFKNLFQALTSWLQTRFVMIRYVRKAQQLFRYYLRCPYTFHLQHNTARLLRNIQLVQPAIVSVILPIILLLTESMVIMALVSLLIYRNPTTAFSAFGILGGVVGITYLIVRRRLGELGITQTRELGELILQAHQAFGSVKETRVLCREGYFEKSYYSHLLPLGDAQLQNSFLGQFPRFVNEIAAVAFVLILLAVFLWQGNPSQEIIITLGLFAVGALRMLPSMTRIGGSLACIRFYAANFNEICDDMIASMNYSVESPTELESRTPLYSDIRFENVTFTYPNASSPALTRISLCIQALESVAFVGPSGAGKTTAVDLLLGLYVPSSGGIYVDGNDIHSDARSWQRNIGYVPQQIYLSDTTIRGNVAFGLPDAQIDNHAVERALEMAQLSDFLASLPEGMNTPVGEHGARLSGGQRQRIGIARALYHNPDVLVMDEATASLDNETEAAFMESIRSLLGKKSMIMIAHRLSTVEQCDKIFFLKEGKFVAEGTFKELVKDCEDFARFAGRI